MRLDYKILIALREVHKTSLGKNYLLDKTFRSALYLYNFSFYNLISNDLTIISTAASKAPFFYLLPIIYTPSVSVLTDHPYFKGKIKSPILKLSDNDFLTKFKACHRVNKLISPYFLKKHDMTDPKNLPIYYQEQEKYISNLIKKWKEEDKIFGYSKSYMMDPAESPLRKLYPNATITYDENGKGTVTGSLD